MGLYLISRKVEKNFGEMRNSGFGKLVDSRQQVFVKHVPEIGCLGSRLGIGQTGTSGRNDGEDGDEVDDESSWTHS